MIQSAGYWLALFLLVPLYWIAPPPTRSWLVALVSVTYVSTLDAGVTVTLIGLSVVFYYLSGIAKDKSKEFGWVVPGLVISALSYLGFFKYMPVVLNELDPKGSDEVIRLVIPLGISYFTFKLIHYAIERRRGTLPPHNLGDFLSYIFLFPIYTAGPIERFDHYSRNRADRFDWDDVLHGVTRIFHGLIKKFVVGGIFLAWIRDQYVGGSIGELLSGLDALHPLQVWLFVILVYLIIYMDFSAYSDIAIGSSRLLGIRIMENFNFPIFAPNIGNFWKRWHMTLAGWCQGYVYMPTIGLTRNPYLAVVLTFTAIGLWHAASLLWLLWGLYHALGVTVYLTWARINRRRKWAAGRLGKALGMAMTFMFVSASFGITAVHNHGGVGDALRILARLAWCTIPSLN